MQGGKWYEYLTEMSEMQDTQQKIPEIVGRKFNRSLGLPIARLPDYAEIIENPVPRKITDFWSDEKRSWKF